MISFKIIVSLYAVIGAVIILDDMLTRKNNSNHWKDGNNSLDKNEAFSGCGEWLYALRPSEKAVAIIKRKTGVVVEVINLPFAPQTIRSLPDTSQIRIIPAGGKEAGELTLKIADYK